MKNISKCVVPGEILGSEAEFLGGKNTFTNEDGDVLALVAGPAIMDEEQRVVAVQNVNTAKNAKSGTVVIAQVMNVRDNTVGVHILTAVYKGRKRVISPAYAVIFISLVDKNYIKDLREFFKIGDLVKAEVSDISPFNIRLRTNEPSLGVVKAFCTQCRAPLHLDMGRLRCLRCNSQETRKVSSEYVLK